MAELRPYKPSLRDRLATMLMGDERASPERRRFVSGLLGSTGLGTDGLGLADMTPAGPVLEADEAIRRGDYQGAAIAIMPVPGAAKAGKAKKLAGKLDDVAPSPKIRAYHGSPHDFDRFDLSRIGTGEGAQAYGHGLYFAENEGVARSYRDALRPGRGSAPEDIAARYLERFGGDQEGALAELRDVIDRSNRLGASYDDVRRLMDAKNIINTAPHKATGRMYEVEIDADPSQFLDWDAPLTKQSPEVQQALRSAALVTEDDVVAKRRALHDALKAQGKPSPFDALFNQPDAYGFDMSGTGSDLYRRMGDPDIASQRLREAGVPGVKYLDQGSRAAGNGSRNYVLFNDQIVKILRKYGVASITALPPAVQLSLGLMAEQSQETAP